MGTRMNSLTALSTTIRGYYDICTKLQDFDLHIIVFYRFHKTFPLSISIYQDYCTFALLYKHLQTKTAPLP